MDLWSQQSACRDDRCWIGVQLLVLWFAGLRLLWFGRDLKYFLISNWLMQQPTEMWKKACCQRMKHCLVWFCQLTLALLLWLSMLLLLIGGDPNRKRRENNVLISNRLMQQPTEMWKKACLEGFDLLKLLAHTPMMWRCCMKLCRESNRLTCQQCKGGAWNVLCWSNWLKSCMRTNPRIQSWTQIRTESCEGNTGRYYETSLFWPLPIGWLSIWWISIVALDHIILPLVAEHYSLWIFIMA